MTRNPPSGLHHARPPLVSHLSNSVPSTPHQYAHEFGSRSRSPSPNEALSQSQSSPRSVRSEQINGRLNALPKGRPACKYESMAAFSRRRMQYDIGDALLEKPKEELKKVLNPDEEGKLSGDMRELYDRLLPTTESEERRRQFTQKLENILRTEWRDHTFQVHVFGSSGNMLCTSESDVDVCIQTDYKQLETMHTLAELLANNGMEKVVCVAAAKVPIVRIWDPDLSLAADVNVNNTLALENTRMIRTYVQLDPRVRPLAMIVKYWTKQRILNDAGLGGTLSSYAWICMIINFLQTRTPAILPALHSHDHEKYIATDGTESGFADDISRFQDFGKDNTETIGELLFHFYRRYAYELDYEKYAISVRHGKLLTRKEKNWDGGSKEGQWRLCIEEPFNVSRNLGNSADSTAFRGIHLEIRRAFGLLADGGQLEKCCEKYEFPPEEKVIFKKPPPGNRGIPLQAPSQVRQPRHNNGTGSLRNSRTGGSGKNGNASYRRSSMGPVPRSNNAYYQSMLTSPMLGANQDMSHLFDYAMLSPPNREQQQVFMQYMAQTQAQHLARAHANAIVQAAGRSRDNSNAGSPSKTPYLPGSPRLDGQYLPANGAYDSPRTNPSSPSIPTAVPVRRTMSRTSIVNGQQNASSIRSQSQPARNQLGYMPNGMPMGYTWDQYGQLYMYPYQAQYMPQQGSNQFQYPTDPSAYQYTGSQRQGQGQQSAGARTPRNSFAYFVADNNSAQAQSQTPTYPDYSVAQIPAFGDLQRSRTHDAPSLVNGSQATSRSPSPIGHPLTASMSAQTAPLPSTAIMEPRQSEYPRQMGGPLIINGSGMSTRQPSTSGYTTPSAHEMRERQLSDAGMSEDSNMAQSFHSIMSLDESRHETQDVFHTPQVHELAPYVNGLGITEQLQGDLGVQPFPPFVPAVPSVPEASVEQSSAPSPKSPSQTQSSGQRKPSIEVNTNSTTETLPTPKPADIRINTLSPVLETKTPSPTIKRRSDLFTKHMANGIAAKVNGTAGAAPNTINVSNPPTTRANVWMNGVPSSLKSHTTAQSIERAQVPQPVNKDPVPPIPAPVSAAAMEATLSSSSAGSPTHVRADGHVVNIGATKQAANQWESVQRKAPKKKGNSEGSNNSNGANNNGGNRSRRGGEGNQNKRKSIHGGPSQRAGNEGDGGRKGSVAAQEERKGG